MNNEQRGVALLIVLMLLALMAALAADMTLSFHSQLQRTRQVNHHLQRQYDIETGGETCACQPHPGR
ncbi:general secretion pathway protein K [Escherichia coli]|uniref:General secretion pathway protein K n=1 Tax=Escherichia coli TaxID=562 RepID=A0A376ML41_ECOLX|nr:general secretion pathway protein K [Escherichia coli]